MLWLAVVVALSVTVTKLWKWRLEEAVGRLLSMVRKQRDRAAHR